MGSSVLRPVVSASSHLRPDYTANERGLSRQKSKRPSFCTPGFEKPIQSGFFCLFHSVKESILDESDRIFTGGTYMTDTGLKIEMNICYGDCSDAMTVTVN
jgi:hypothetical protein